MLNPPYNVAKQHAKCNFAQGGHCEAERIQIRERQLSQKVIRWGGVESLRFASRCESPSGFQTSPLIPTKSLINKGISAFEVPFFILFRFFQNLLVKNIGQISVV